MNKIRDEKWAVMEAAGAWILAGNKQPEVEREAPLEPLELKPLNFFSWKIDGVLGSCEQLWALAIPPQPLKE